MNMSDAAPSKTSEEVQNTHTQKGSALSVTEVLALEAT